MTNLVDIFIQYLTFSTKSLLQQLGLTKNSNSDDEFDSQGASLLSIYVKKIRKSNALIGISDNVMQRAMNLYFQIKKSKYKYVRRVYINRIFSAC